MVGRCSLRQGQGFRPAPAHLITDNVDFAGNLIMEHVMEQDEASRLAGENPKADETAGVDLEEMTKKD